MARGPESWVETDTDLGWVELSYALDNTTEKYTTECIWVKNKYKNAQYSLESGSNYMASTDGGQQMMYACPKYARVHIKLVMALARCVHISV